jgi:hypothetical protein
MPDLHQQILAQHLLEIVYRGDGGTKHDMTYLLWLVGSAVAQKGGTPLNVKEFLNVIKEWEDKPKFKDWANWDETSKSISVKESSKPRKELATYTPLNQVSVKVGIDLKGMGDKSQKEFKHIIVGKLVNPASIDNVLSKLTNKNVLPVLFWIACGSNFAIVHEEYLGPSVGSVRISKDFTLLQLYSKVFSGLHTRQTESMVDVFNRDIKNFAKLELPSTSEESLQDLLEQKEALERQLHEVIFKIDALTQSTSTRGKKTART